MNIPAWVFSALVLLAAGAAYAQQAPPAESPGTPAPIVPSDRLPILATVGDFPPAAESLVLEINAEGAMYSDGKFRMPLRVRQILEERATASRGASGDARGNAPLNLVLRADRDLRWRGVWVALAFAYAKEARVNRVFFAARPADGGPEGAFAAFMITVEPSDPSPPDVPLLPVDLLDGEGPGMAGASLLSYLRNERGNEWVPSATLRIGDNVTTGAALEAADALLRWGVRGILFGTTSTQLTAASPSPNPRIQVFGKPIPAPPAGWIPEPAQARAKGRLAGSFGYPGDDSSGPPKGRTPIRLFVGPRRLPEFTEPDPVPSGGVLVTVDVTPSPRLLVGKETLDLAGLRDLLAKKCGPRLEDGFPGAAEAVVLLRIDGDCLWRDLLWVFEVATSKEAGAPRVLLGGRRVGTETEGCVFVGLPREPEAGGAGDKDAVTTRLTCRDAGAAVLVHVQESRLGACVAGRVPVAAVERLRALAGKDGGIRGLIDADPAVPFREIASAIEAHRLAGFRDIRVVRVRR